MTMPSERINAIRNTLNFLRDVINPAKTPRLPRGIRKQAYWLLRHFPHDYEMEIVEKECDCKVFNDPFKKKAKKK